ncbi:hypothetical protein [Patulibacter minatonensis]|uniref:hypothetical protein n=1 Tax=Patulibacter minatonensis TaxID=298163 RepID=UPI0005686CA9|nr:hypothetical protein [Patulibacter minatonensis]
MHASPPVRRALAPLLAVVLLAASPALAGAAVVDGDPAPAGAAAEIDAPTGTGTAATPRSEIDPTEPSAPGTADPGALATGEARLQAADPGDLWAVADAATTPIDGLWNADQGAYVVAGVARARLNAEMLLVHSYAALAGRTGTDAHPERIEPLVKLLTGPMYVPTLNGKVAPAPAPGHSVTIHAPGFADPVGGLVSMHQALDAVAARALAAAWRARDIAGLSQESRDLIVDRVRAVARSPFWRSPSRLLNQINWSADLYAADATVTGDPMLLRRDYRDQLIWFAEHARKTAYPGGSPNLGTGGAFHYLPQRRADNATNRSDTAEYANITLGALAYLDQARAAGMGQLPKRVRDTLRGWVRRTAWGDWSTSGYLNWDSGKGLSRLHLTQYWLLALRGFAAGTEGSTAQAYLPSQQATTRWLVRRAVATYQQRAAAASSVVLPATAFGLSGGPLVTPTFDGLTGTARFASTLAEMADRGLASPADTGADLQQLPDAVTNDADIGRTAVTTSRFATAFLKPWSPLKVGGLEPARLLDSRGRALTGVGGSGDGALGLRLRAAGRTLVDTQRGVYKDTQTVIAPARSRLNVARTMDGPVALTGTDKAASVRLTVKHRVASTSIRTTYVVRNLRKETISAQLRIPTYGSGDAGSLKVGQRIGPAALSRLLTVVTPTGSRFQVRFKGLPPKARGEVVAVAPQNGNPTPGPQLVVLVTLPAKRTTTIERTIVVPSAG